MIDGDEKFCGVAAFGAWVDVWVALVDALHGGGLVATFQASDEVAEDGAPVDDVGDGLADVFSELGWDVCSLVTQEWVRMERLQR